MINRRTNLTIKTVTAVKILCGDAPVADNAFLVHGGSYEVLHKLVEFDCSPGYILSGQKALRCSESGEWTGIPPTCIAAGQFSHTFPWWTLFISFVVLFPVCAYFLVQCYAAVKRFLQLNIVVQ